MFAIIRKTLFEKRIALLVWAIGAAAMVWLTMIFYPSFSQSGQFSDALKSLPPQLQGLIGKATDYKTMGGYIDTVVFNLRIPMVTITMAIIFGIGLSAGDEERGVLSTLLAQPVSRGRVLWEKFMALMSSIFIVHVGVFVGLLLSLVAINETYDLDKLIAVVFGCFLISALFGALAYGLGSFTGKKSLSTAIVSVVAFGAFLIDSMAPSVEALQHIQKLSPYYYYSSPSLAVNGIDWSYALLQVAVTLALLALGWSLFRHRDIAA